MLISQLQARDFRLFSALRLEAHPQFNFITGDNGVGKTSLLEAVHVLGRAASWRVPAAQLARDGTVAWRVTGQVEEEAGVPAQTVRITWQDRETGIDWGGQPLGLSELVRKIPLQILDPGMHKLLEEGPGIRRRVLDWGVFHVEHSFLETWRRARRALRQRNVVLREGGNPRLLAPWNHELAEAGELLTAKRLAHVAELEKRTRRLLEQLLPGEQWELRYSRGWDADRSYLEVLESSAERDRRLGLTAAGPQRAELGFYGGSADRGTTAVKGRISRGQQKLLIAAFTLAQCAIVAERSGGMPILLVDDFSAELSAGFQGRLMQAVEAYPGQKFITALEPLALMKKVPSAHMFHVEHGALHKVERW
ncbi:MAG: DNA replication and repair protein RecF [Nevskia sp.]|nr:DNA replication and repair protein RecF [Nevskia sp.]